MSPSLTDITIRPATEADLPIIVDLYRKLEEYTTGEAETTLEQLKLFFSMHDFSLEKDTRLLFNDAGEPLVFGGVMRRNESRIMNDYVYYPEKATLEQLDAIRELLESRSRERIVDAAPDVRVYIASYYETRDPLLSQLLTEDRGYFYKRGHYNMQIELTSEPPAPIWPEGIRLTTVSGPEQYRSVYEAQETIFADHWGHYPQPYEQWLKFGPDREDIFDPTLWYLPMAGDEIAAVCLCGIEDGIPWVHELGVKRAYRKHGLGLAMLHQAFGEFYRRGYTVARLGVDAQSLTGATRLYERAGMYKLRHYIRFEKDLRAGREIELQELSEEASS